eukprot:Sdes_comp18558_c0_seq1m8649
MPEVSGASVDAVPIGGEGNPAEDALKNPNENLENAKKHSGNPHSYLILPVDKQLADILAPQWISMETSYVSTVKHILRMIRHERERIILYFFSMKKSFAEFLQRPDTKQEFVSQWQKSYNMIDDDMRDDPDTKAELHMR